MIQILLVPDLLRRLQVTLAAVPWCPMLYLFFTDPPNRVALRAWLLGSAAGGVYSLTPSCKAQGRHTPPGAC